MKRLQGIYISLCVAATLLLGSCAHEFNQVYKSSDLLYKYEYAKQCYASGKYTHSITLLSELVTLLKGTENGQECLFMLGMAEYKMHNYETASEYFKKYYSSYPRGTYAELAKFYVGKSLYMLTPEPRLDQSMTYTAITQLQEYLDVFPNAKFKNEAQQHMVELQDKLVQKELHSARLYYNLGSYFGNCLMGGNNYEACIVTSQNALKDYPYSNKREDFSVLILKSKYELAQMSVESKKLERYQDAQEECYGFISEYPDSDNRELAEKILKKCKIVTKD